MEGSSLNCRGRESRETAEWKVVSEVGIAFRVVPHWQSTRGMCLRDRKGGTAVGPHWQPERARGVRLRDSTLREVVP
jgi:hypothetical protein